MTVVLEKSISEIKEIAKLSEALTIVGDCTSLLLREFALPINLPKIDTDTRERIKDGADALNKAIMDIAQQMGVSKYVVPHITTDCDMKMLEVGIDTFAVAYDEETAYVGDEDIGEILFLALATWDIKIPIAFAPHAKNVVEPKYTETLLDLMTTALFLHRNPWVQDVVRTALERTYGESAKSLIDAFTTANKLLRIIGATAFDSA